MLNTISAVLWFFGAVMWIVAAYYNAQSGFSGFRVVVAMSLTNTALYTALGFLYLLK